MKTAPLDTPRSERRPDLPIVFPLGAYVYFPDSCDDYCISFEQLREDVQRWIYHLDEKPWWTSEHEHALRCILDLEGENGDESEGGDYED